MNEDKIEGKKGILINNIVMIVSVIGTFILGRFSGIGAAIIGWFAYDYSRKN